MMLRDFLKQLVPPIVANSNGRASTWSGIYRDFSEVPKSGDGYQGLELTAITRAYTESIMANSEAGHNRIVGEHALLPLLVSLIATHSDRVRVLDFGGGMGIGYLSIKQALPNGIDVDYHVVENKLVCEHGAQILEGHDQIRFHETLPVLTDVDIVYASSSLQYVEDYKEVITRLCDYQARFIFLVKLSTGPFATYATTQVNLGNNAVPYWFLNQEEIVDLIAKKGYRLIYQSALEREYPQDNFPVEYRMGRASNLLFSRTRRGPEVS